MLYRSTLLYNFQSLQPITIQFSLKVFVIFVVVASISFSFSTGDAKILLGLTASFRPSLMAMVE